MARNLHINDRVTRYGEKGIVTNVYAPVRRVHGEEIQVQFESGRKRIVSPASLRRIRKPARN